MSTDEKTGMQALERAQPTKPPRPGSARLDRAHRVRIQASWDLDPHRKPGCRQGRDRRSEHRPNADRTGLRGPHRPDDRRRSRRQVDLHHRSAEHPYVTRALEVGRGSVRPERGTRQGEKGGRPRVDAQPQAPSRRQVAPHSVRLHASPLILTFLWGFSPPQRMKRMRHARIARQAKASSRRGPATWRADVSYCRCARSSIM